MPPPDLAILIPVFNGGRRLQETLRSIGKLDLEGVDAEVLVCDNASTDGASQGLPDLLDNGARVHVKRIDENVGRVENWNQVYGWAAERGARYAWFLFVGDRAVPEARLAPLIHSMDDQGAGLALVRYVFLDEAGRRLGRANRFRGGAAAVEPPTFLARTIGRGVWPFGPLQAHVIRIEGPDPLHFDATDPTFTDQVSMARFVARSQRPIILWPRRLVAWVRSEERYHATLDPLRHFVLERTRVEALCEELGTPADLHWAETIRFLGLIKRRRVNPISARALWHTYRNLRKARRFSHPVAIRAALDALVAKTAMGRIPGRPIPATMTEEPRR